VREEGQIGCMRRVAGREKEGGNCGGAGKNQELGLWWGWSTVLFRMKCILKIKKKRIILKGANEFKSRRNKGGKEKGERGFN